MTSDFSSSINERIEQLCQWVRNVDGSPSAAAAWPPSLEPTLSDDLETLRGLLAEICPAGLLDLAEQMGIHNKSARLWLRDLRAVFYDVDDVLDGYECKLLHPEAKGRIQDPVHSPDHPVGSKRKQAEQVSGTPLLPSLSIKDPPTTGTTGEEIQKSASITRRSSPFEKGGREIREIQKAVMHMVQDPVFFILKRLALTERWNLGEDHGSGVSSSSLVMEVPEVQMQGRQHDIDKLIHGLLLSHECRNNSSVTVIQVTGRAGVGKTTLAHHVYNHPGIREHFKLRGWVSASEDFHFDDRLLTRKIVESVTGAPCDLTERDELRRRLMEVLQGKRFLLVLDNANAVTWYQLFILGILRQVPQSEKGSAIIVPTQYMQLVERTPSLGLATVAPHKLECLSWDDCWEIFKLYAFHGLNPRDTEELAEIGRKIVLKCNGLPLAVRALGSMLRNEADARSWEDVLQSAVWEMGADLGEIHPALLLSFQHLPPHLKPCLVYCSLFPPGYRFHKDELVLLWMAQGYIQGRGSEDVTEIGAAYVDELRQRSFFQCMRLSDTSTFVMHDHIYDLAQYFFSREHIRLNRMVFHVPKATRHLSILAANGDDIKRLLGSSLRLRTLHFFNVNKLSDSLGSTIGGLTGLRTLVLRDQQIFELPESVGRLKHLRYLDLSGTDIGRLPRTIAVLYFLQTLLLRRCKNLESLPDVVFDLTNLKCLEYSRYL